MLTVDAIYDGEKFKPVEKVDLPVNARVTLTVNPVTISSEDTERLQLKKLQEKLLQQGLITHIPTGKPRDANFQPVRVQGKPVSETIIEERR
jgi:predicted DNA-binding antitoxin AbrB/MazE fold protein